MNDTPDALWEPSRDLATGSRMGQFLRWVGDQGRVAAGGYHDLWQWSVSDLDGFWSSVWDFFEVDSAGGYSDVLTRRTMPGATWFPGARLNYARQALRGDADAVALVHESEDGHATTMTRGELRDRVAAVAGGLRDLGVGPGDRVAAYLPNVPEAVIAFLATASLGAVWSGCPPEFGPRSIVDRFAQIEPKVLVATERYLYRGKMHDRRAVVEEVRASLPSLRASVRVPYGGETPAGYPDAPPSMTWDELASRGSPAGPEWVGFDHPLWIVYSSGTTGPPKPIVHGQGGIVLEHLKWLGLHADLGADDRFFWFTTTGWIMWNAVVGSLLTGSAIVLYDGDPAYPDVRRLWRLAEQAGVTVFGGSPPFFDACRRAGLEPGGEFDLAALRAIGSTGSPLTPDGFRWFYDAVKDDVHVGSASGGTDVASAFVGPCPLLPVVAGEIQCRLLGAKVEAYDPAGRSLVGEVGELVVTEPLPSMPLGFWNDPDGARLTETYFATFPGVWRHGDWITITPRGTCVITGRSDATLKRSGVRMGTSEFYAVVERVPGVADSLVIDVPVDASRSELVLLVVPEDAQAFDEALVESLRTTLREQLSPRHVPDRILQVSQVPRTLNGKKLEVPVKRMFCGVPAEQAVSRGSVAEPSAVDEIAAIAHQYRSTLSATSTEVSP